MFEKKSDYDEFIELTKKLWDKTGGKSILQTLNSIYDLTDEKEPEIKMNRLIEEIFGFATKYKNKKLMKLIVEKYNFVVEDGPGFQRGPDLQQLSIIETDIESYQTKYSTEFIDSLIVTIYDKYKIIDYRDVTDEMVQFSFFVYWILFFHPSKIKDYVDYIFLIDHKTIFQFLAMKSGHSFISPKHLSKIDQKQRLINMLFTYLKNSQSQAFYKFIKQFVYDSSTKDKKRLGFEQFNITKQVHLDAFIAKNKKSLT